MAEQVSSRKRPLEHTSEEEEKDTPKKKKVAVTKVVSRVANGFCTPSSYSSCRQGPKAERRGLGSMRRSSVKHPMLFRMVIYEHTSPCTQAMYFLILWLHKYKG